MPSVDQRLLVAGEALLADAQDLRTGHVPDARVPEPDQVLGREPPAEPVVHLDERNRVRVDVAVQADDREAVLDEPGDPVGGQPQTIDEGAVDLLRAQEAQVLLLALRVPSVVQRSIV